MKICSVETCHNDVNCKGLCRAHYKKLWKYGDPLAGATKRKPAEEYFSAMISRSGECIVWNGPKNLTGYGTIWADGKSWLAHRYSWTVENGDIPEGMFLDHMCHNPPCVNTRHLRIVTRKQNNENLIGANRNSTSGYRGVNKSQGNKWRVLVGHNGQRHYGGLFDDVEEANRAAIELRNKLHTHNDVDRAA